jgi:hypothetical protein
MMMRNVAFVILAACTGGGGGEPSVDAHGGDASAWVGNWTETGTQATTCGAASGTSQISELVVIDEGSEPDTIKTTANGCALIWNLDGDAASLRSGQACTVSANGVEVTVGWTQSSATLAGDTIAATATGLANNGCSFMQQVTLVRMR